VVRVSFFNVKLIRAAIALIFAAFISVPASAQVLQCAPYAREVSGIALSGRAAGWWDQAEGRYDRGTAPKAGAVLAFRATHSMRAGHVAMVSKVIDERHVLLNHANWSRPGMIERSAMAEDVSANGDWSEVRVFYAPSASSACAPRPPMASSMPTRPTVSMAPSWRCVEGFRRLEGPPAGKGSRPFAIPLLSSLRYGFGLAQRLSAAGFKPLRGSAHPGEL
jgi:hypothetical protein